MTVAQFDAWIAGISSGAYTASTADERNDLAELNALRDLQTARRELHRLETVAQLTSDEPEPLRQAATAQIEATRVRVDSLVNYLHSAGWEI